MQKLLLDVLGRLFAGVTGLVAGFFVAFNAVFSDILGLPAMAAAVAYVAFAYLVLGLLFGVTVPAMGVRATLWLAPPGLVLVVFSLIDELDRFTYSVAVMGAVVAGSALGAWAGVGLISILSRLRHRGPSGGATV